MQLLEIEAPAQVLMASKRVARHARRSVPSQPIDALGQTKTSVSCRHLGSARSGLMQFSFVSSSGSVGAPRELPAKRRSHRLGWSLVTE